MYTLLHGDTWYGKYGFVPCDPNTSKEDKILMKQYEKNRKIVTTVKIKDTPLFEYIKSLLKKKYKTGYERKYKNFKKNTKDMIISDFFKLYLNKYEDSCDDFYKFYRGFASDMGIANFDQMSFVLNLRNSNFDNDNIEFGKLDAQ